MDFQLIKRVLVDAQKRFNAVGQVLTPVEVSSGLTLGFESGKLVLDDGSTTTDLDAADKSQLVQMVTKLPKLNTQLPIPPQAVFSLPE